MKKCDGYFQHSGIVLKCKGRRPKYHAPAGTSFESIFNQVLFVNPNNQQRKLTAAKLLTFTS